MDTKFFSCYILGHTGSSYITVYLLFDGCDYFISQKQEEGNLVWKMIGVNRARQVFKNRRPIFRIPCNWERDRQDVKEVVGKDSIILGRRWTGEGLAGMNSNSEEFSLTE